MKTCHHKKVLVKKAVRLMQTQESTKDKIIHALETALVTMTARLEMHQEAIEELMAERLMYCSVTPREVRNEL